MKKVIISIFLIVICYFGFGQYPLTQNLGSSSTLVQVPANGGLLAGLIPRAFADTTAASLTNLKFYDGAIIKTTSPVALWYRYLAATQWVQVLPSGGSGGQRAWLIGGQGGIFTSPVDAQIIGVTTNQPFGFMTNNVTRLVIDNTGIKAQTGTTIGLGYDPSDANKLTAFSASSSAWALLGNAGTNPTTNFIGTTDVQSLVFKVNSTKSGIIDITNYNTSLGFASLASNLTGIRNTAFGTATLNSLTATHYNTAIGYASMQTGLGNYNTAVGQSSLEVNSGDSNIAIGSFAGMNNTLSSRLYINSLQRANLQSDTIQSIIYGAQDVTAANQRLYFNSRVYAPYLANTTTANILYYNTTSGLFTYGAVPTGTVTGTGTTDQMTKWTSSTAIGNALMTDNGSTTIGFPISAGVFNFGGGATAAELRFLEPSGSGTNYSSFKAVAQGANITYSLPPTVGAAGTFLSDVAGNGVLTWESAAGGAPTWNSITSPTGDQTLTFQAGESSTWTDQNTTEDLFTVNDATSTTKSQFSLNRTSTALASGNNIMELVSSGANGTNAITATGARISVTNTNGTSGTNIGLNVTASGATTGNYALIVPNGGGMVGIGTSAPTSPIEFVHGTSSSDVTIQGLTAGTSNTTYTSRGRWASNFNVSYFSQNASYNGSAWVADDANRPVAMMQLNCFGSADGQIIFRTSSSNNAADGTDQLQIYGNGNVEVTTLAGSGSRAVLADATGVLSAPVSDFSVKQNIQPLKSAINTLMRLNPVTFEYIDGWKNYGQGTQIGFIAQDIQKVLPNSTFTTKATGKMGYASTDLIPLLVKVAQEQQQQINELKAEIIKLQQK